MRTRHRRGFSLVELFVVLVVIGVLVGLAIPRYHSFKHRFYVAVMVSDLRNLASDEEAYWSDRDSYSSDFVGLNFVPTQDVTINFVTLTASGWSALATHARDSSTCAVYYGSAPVLPPATVKTIIGCN
ncbi:MAG TPA: prepilin-type N-terminal cleavage/methylation domain-containing protein [Gemmatimonadaceae bacterium]|nr:prepilin-type N-terminal cleavage/methylation domain-containing protein [Gemmatimonadaceae bacterium]